MSIEHLFRRGRSGSERSKSYVEENNNDFFPRSRAGNNCGCVNEFEASCLQGCGKREEDLLLRLLCAVRTETTHAF